MNTHKVFIYPVLNQRQELASDDFIKSSLKSIFTYTLQSENHQEFGRKYNSCCSNSIRNKAQCHQNSHNYLLEGIHPRGIQKVVQCWKVE